MAVTEKGTLGSKGTGGGSFSALSLTESTRLSCRKIRDTEGLNCALEPWRSQVVLCPGPQPGLSASVISTYLLLTWDVRARELKLDLEFIGFLKYLRWFEGKAEKQW